SRRRHTRFSRDWSSDVCSSDLTALEHAAHWPAVLSVLEWFAAHPRPGLYLRQLDIPGVDTKFIEAHRGLLMELLDVVLPEAAVRSEERRVGKEGRGRRGPAAET